MTGARKRRSGSPSRLAKATIGRTRAFLAAVDQDRAAGGDLEKALWGPARGMWPLASRIVAAIPAHRVYVEPFAGGTPVFWEKPPSEIEVLASTDPETAFALRFVKNLTPDRLHRLQRKSWVGDRERFERL